MSKYLKDEEEMIREIQEQMLNRKNLSMNPFFRLSPTDDSIERPGDARYPSGPPPFDTSEVRPWVQPTRSDITWSSIIGNAEAARALQLAIEAPQQSPELLAAYGIRPASGVLLYGPPGCGKTMFAKAAAAAIGGPHYLLVTGGNLRSMWHGETEKNIVKLFAHARSYRERFGVQLLIFIDEAEALLPPRGRSRLDDDVVAEFLAQMDGLAQNDAFIVLASNRPDSIDEALLRDGRISRKIRVARPDYYAAIDIATQELSTVPLGRGIRREDLAITLADELFHPRHIIHTSQFVRGTISEGKASDIQSTDLHFCLSDIVSGAMIVGLVNRAKLIAFERDREYGEVRGVYNEDMVAATTEVFADNVNLSHRFALEEFIERKLGELRRKEMN